jgi:hypothetical protein
MWGREAENLCPCSGNVTEPGGCLRRGSAAARLLGFAGSNLASGMDICLW